MKKFFLFWVLLFPILAHANDGANWTPPSYLKLLSPKRVDAVSYTKIVTPTFQIQGGLGYGLGKNFGSAPAVFIKYNPLVSKNTYGGFASSLEFSYNHFADRNLDVVTGRYGINVIGCIASNMLDRIPRFGKDIPAVLVDPELFLGAVATKHSNQDKVLVGAAWAFNLNFYFKSKNKAQNELFPVGAFVGFGIDIFFNGYIKGIDWDPENEWKGDKQWAVVHLKAGLTANFGGNKRKQEAPH